MSFEASGRLAEIFETQKVSDRFQKREFILEIKSTSANGFEFVDLIKFQLTQDKCAQLDQFSVDDPVKVSFNLRGRKWERDGQVSYFTNLEAWRIEKTQDDSGETLSDSQPDLSAPSDDNVPFPTQPPPTEEDSGNDDLPF